MSEINVGFFILIGVDVIATVMDTPRVVVANEDEDWDVKDEGDGEKIVDKGKIDEAKDNDDDDGDGDGDGTNEAIVKDEEEGDDDGKNGDGEGEEEEEEDNHADVKNDSGSRNLCSDFRGSERNDDTNRGGGDDLRCSGAEYTVGNGDRERFRRMVWNTILR